MNIYIKFGAHRLFYCLKLVLDEEGTNKQSKFRKTLLNPQMLEKTMVQTVSKIFLQQAEI